jgi:predicted PurR-regulated permease PerM
MTNSSQTSNQATFVANALEAFIRIGIVGLLAIWCFQIGRPFFQIILWGIIIAVALYPIHHKIQSALGGRDKLAASLIALFALILIIITAVVLSGSLLDGAQQLSTKLKEGTLQVPPAPQSVRSWPVVGEPLYQGWRLATVNLEAAMSRFTPQLKAFSHWLLSRAASTGVGILQFIVSIVIAGILLANADSGHKAAKSIGTRLAGERGEELVDLAGSTLRSVTKGILGVAVIQALLAGLGCLAAGVPAAGLWALLVLIVAVAQIPTLLVLGPIIIYVFSSASVVTAVLFTIWSLFVSLCDGFLKPILGAIVLVVGYQIFLAWLHQRATLIEESNKS